MNIICDDEVDELPLPTIDFEGKVQLPAKLGRPVGKHVSMLDKELIAIHSNLGAGQRELAEVMGTSQAEVSLVERGLNHTNLDGQKPDEHLQAVGLQAKNKIIDLATTKLMAALGIFDPEGLEQKELPGAALKLASVAEKFTGNRENAGQQINFIVYQPQRKREEDFGDVITLNER